MKTLFNLQASICVVALILLSSGPSVVTAQLSGNVLGRPLFVDSSVDQLAIVVGSAQRLKFPYKVPELLVSDQDIVKADPIAPSEILITGLKPGLTTITFSDPEKNLQTVTVEVTTDTRKLEAALKRHFPDSKIRVHALQTGVILKGTVARADQINTVVAIAKDYFPTTVINELQIDASQVVAIKVKVYEVNRTKLRTLGIDWAVFGDGFGIASSVSDIIQAVGLTTGSVTSAGQETFSFGVVDGNTSFFKFMEALEQNNMARLLDQPTLVAQNGRPAEFLSGGEIPIAVASGLGTNSIEFRPFGTKLDMVPLIHGQGEMTLEVRAEVSEVDNSLSFGSGVPGFRVRRVNTGVRMKEGHTLALAGDYQESTESEKRGLPFLMDSPIWGSLFRRNTTTTSETELVFLITPRFIAEVDPSQVPRMGPGQLTDDPSRVEQFVHGYVEVPKCNENCVHQDGFDSPHNVSGAYQDYTGVSNQTGSQVYPANNTYPANGNPLSGGQYPVYQSNGPNNVPAQNSNYYGNGFGWPQNNNQGGR